MESQITGHTHFFNEWWDLVSSFSIACVKQYILFISSQTTAGWAPGCLSLVTVAKLTWPSRTCSTLLTLCEGNPPAPGGFPSQRASNTKARPCHDIIMCWDFVRSFSIAYMSSIRMFISSITAPTAAKQAPNCPSPVTLTKLTRPARTCSTLLALCEGNPPITGGFPSQRASNTENISMSLCVANLWDHSALLTCQAVGSSFVA